jgi:2,4-dienoyl-CoA reductase-like NADH-dependent reductase (Old Yellow Enzyme family)
MSAVDERERIAALSPMVQAVHDAGGRIVIQLGHGGLYALEGWHREFKERRTSPPWVPSRPPLYVRAVLGSFHVLSTEEVEGLVRRFGVVAKWAREAGYDGVQLAGGNAKLLHQFLSPTYNRRDDRYGGSWENRFRVFAEIRRAVAEEAGDDFPVLLKYAASERGFWGAVYGIEAGVRIAKMAEDAGFAALTPAGADTQPNTAICRGDYPGVMFAKERVREAYRAAGGGKAFHVARASAWIAARRYPFTPVWNRPVFRAVKAAVRIPVFAVGGIRDRHTAEEILRAGEADAIGVGRPFYAEPELARRFLEPAAPDGVACVNSNNCVVSQMLGMAAACYNPDVHRRLRSETKR